MTHENKITREKEYKFLGWAGFTKDWRDNKEEFAVYYKDDLEMLEEKFRKLEEKKK